MKRYKTKNWYLSLLPFLLGLGIAIILNNKIRLLPVIQIRIDLASSAIFLGAIISILFIYRQLIHQSQKRKTKEMLKTENEEHKQFLVRLDHELKNPLSAIKTGTAYLGQLTSEVKPKKNQVDLQKTITQISSQADRINRLISDLRKLAELETYTIEFRKVNINLLLEQVVENTRSNPDCKDRKVILSLPTTPWQLPDLETDEDLFYLCFSNLMDNALKYTLPNGIIEIRAYENHHHIVIEIADNGIGIPENEIGKVWGRLYRAKNSRGYPGNGLGLSIVQTTVNRLNGACSIRSQEGKGTVFTLELPK